MNFYFIRNCSLNNFSFFVYTEQNTTHMKHLLLFTLGISAYILFVGASACVKEPSPDRDRGIPLSDSALIDHLFRNYQVPNPGASFIVIKDGEIVKTEAYGYADVENNVLASPNTHYRMASVSKQFTAMAIMLLVHRGELTYESRLTDIFPEFPDYGKEISIRHLLTHRSGLVDYGRFLIRERTGQLFNQEMLDSLLTTTATEFTPGSKFRYSNTAYALLPLIVEKLSGQAYAEFMQENIFAPLGMETTTTYSPDIEIENRAYGYIVEDSEITPRDQSLTSALLGDGSIYTSVKEYFHWDQGLYTDKLLPQKTIQEAFQAWNTKGKSDKEGYGYGWFVNYVDGVKVLEHGGSTIGFSLYVMRVPSKKLSVAVFSNRNQGDPEFRDISRALLSLYSDGGFPLPERY